MSAVSCSDGSGANADLLRVLLASRQSSHLTPGPTEGLASLMELAAVFKQHSAAAAADTPANAATPQPYHSWQFDAATRVLSKLIDEQQMQHSIGHTAVPDRQQHAAEPQQQQQQQEQKGAAPDPEPLNHRSSSRRRKPKVACSSAYGPNEVITNKYNIKEEQLDTQQTDYGHMTVDEHDMGTVKQQELPACNSAAVMNQQQHQHQNWGRGLDNGDSSLDHHTRGQLAVQQQHSAAAKTALSKGRKRPASSSGTRATAGRGSSLDPAAAAAMTAAPAVRWSGSGDLSDGTDSGMLEELDDPALDQSTAAAAGAAVAAKPGSTKQERLKEKNRLAQRRFRARQKTMLEQMQVRMEELAKQVDKHDKDLTVLHQENSMLRNIVQEQQKALMSAMVVQQQQQDDDGTGSAPATAGAVMIDESKPVKGDLKAATAAAGELQYQQLQQLYHEHWQQQQEHHMLAAAAAALGGKTNAA